MARASRMNPRWTSRSSCVISSSIFGALHGEVDIVSESLRTFTEEVPKPRLWTGNVSLLGWR
jgi:hypothetical protein